MILVYYTMGTYSANLKFVSKNRANVGYSLNGLVEMEIQLAV